MPLRQSPHPSPLQSLRRTDPAEETSRISDYALQHIDQLKIMKPIIPTHDPTKQSPPARKARKHLKIKFVLFALRSALILATPTLWAQNTNTNSLPLVQTVKYQEALEHDRSLGELALLPPGLKEKMMLTDAQRIELKPAEDDFAATARQYQIANQPRIDAAMEANRQARASKDVTQIQAARTQLQQVWAGLQPYRDTSITKIKPLLTPAQLKVLEDPKNQWRENHADEANDPSAN